MDTPCYGERFRKMLGAFTAWRLPFLEEAHPLSGEELAEFVARLPVCYRYDMHLLRRIVQVK